jgi:exosortase J
MLWLWIALLAVAGSFGVSPQFAKLWEIWTTDPLRSIGMFILPISIVLILLVWQQYGWELEGAWWGLLPVALAFAPLFLSQQLILFWTAGEAKVNILPSVLPIYLYASGIVLLFAGTRVWRRAWFPLALLLLMQPVPTVVVHFLDLPLQDLCAHIARSFASLLGFSPANSELLHLMFTPDFGMFIAPGCDGMRGAVTLGYGALIIGYLKRVSALRWSTYFVGAFLLGHLFNLIRLCSLVLYYKIAVGHIVREHAAKQADYVIGGMLFLVAAFLLLWIIRRKENKTILDGTSEALTVRGRAGDRGPIWKAAILTPLVLAAVIPGANATRRNPETLVSAILDGEVTVRDLDARIPPQVGAYKLARAWQEHQGGVPVEEDAVFEKMSSHEIQLGIWLPQTDHSIRQSLKTHGESPEARTIKLFTTAAGRMIQVNTAIYDDGVTDTFTGDIYCTPSGCQPGLSVGDGVHMAITKTLDHTTRGKRAIPIFFKLQTPHTGSTPEAAYQELSNECQDFLSHLDLLQLSQRFQ